MGKIIYRVLLFIFPMVSIHVNGFSQHQAGREEDMPVLYDQVGERDSLMHVLHDRGTFKGHFRTFFMNTVNEGSNPDYFALAMGGGIAYYSPVIKNFQVGLSGFIIYNLASSDLAKNGFSNRYELGLFDVSDAGNRGDLDRLENLYLRYYFNSRQKSFLQAGKFHARTPLMNLQDGRMRPNLQEGLWLEIKDWEKIKFTAGWIWKTSPRSTVEWYKIGESVGVYANGRAVNGQPASYYGHVQSNKMLIGNIEWTPVQDLNYQYWNYYADNLFNIALQKIELRKRSANKTWLVGFQYLWEKSLSDGSIPLESQYIGPEEQSYVFSARIGVTDKRNVRGWSLNYSRITAHGRFLFPREWGIEPLYSFINRERNEGAGDVHGIMLEHAQSLDKGNRLSFRGRGGVYKMPPVAEANLNKYTMPSYYQLSLEVNYEFKGFLHGLETQMLYSYKGNLEANPEYEPALIHNKTRMHHLSVRVDYYF
ncbi:MAG: OprD family outer membrane porin [Cyclobacteriaceae bacterium]